MTIEDRLALLSNEGVRDRLRELNAQIAALNMEVSALTWQRQQLQAEDKRRHLKPPAPPAPMGERYQ